MRSIYESKFANKLDLLYRQTIQTETFILFRLSTIIEARLDFVWKLQLRSSAEEANWRTVLKQTANFAYRIFCKRNILPLQEKEHKWTYTIHTWKSGIIRQNDKWTVRSSQKQMILQVSLIQMSKFGYLNHLRYLFRVEFSASVFSRTWEL